MKTNLILTAIILVPTLATAEIAQADGSAASTTSLAPLFDPTPSQIVRLSQLPTVAALTNAAASQGVAVRQITLTSGQVIVVYRFNNGQSTTICYQVPQAAAVTSAPVAAVPAVSSVQVAAPATVVAVPVTTVVVPAQPAVLYEVQPSAPAYAYDAAYYPWYCSAPVCIGYGAFYNGNYFHGSSYHRSYNLGGSYHRSGSRGGVRSWR